MNKPQGAKVFIYTAPDGSEYVYTVNGGNFNNDLPSWLMDRIAEDYGIEKTERTWWKFLKNHEDILSKQYIRQQDYAVLFENGLNEGGILLDNIVGMQTFDTLLEASIKNIKNTPDIVVVTDDDGGDDSGGDISGGSSGYIVSGDVTDGDEKEERDDPNHISGDDDDIDPQDMNFDQWVNSGYAVDYNGDGEIDMSDFTTFLSSFTDDDDPTGEVEDVVETTFWTIDTDTFEEQEKQAALQAYYKILNINDLVRIANRNALASEENAALARSSAFRSAQAAYVEGLQEQGIQKTAMGSTGIMSNNINSMLSRNMDVLKGNQREMVSGGLLEAENWLIEAQNYRASASNLNTQKSFLEYLIGQLGREVNWQTGEITTTEERQQLYEDLEDYEIDAKYRDQYMSVLNSISGVTSLIGSIINWF